MLNKEDLEFVNTKWFKLDVFIRQNTTGVISLCESSHEIWNAEFELTKGKLCQFEREIDGWKRPEWSEFWWSDGNGSCDCNRHCDFLRGLGEEDEWVDCSDGYYEIRIVVPKTGEVVYDEWET